MIELTHEQRQQLEIGQAVNLIDPETDREYVLLRKDVYDQVRQMLNGSEWTGDELRQMLAQAFQNNGWDEPGMEAYDRYEEEVRKRCP